MFGLGLSDTILSALVVGLAVLAGFAGLRYWSVSDTLEEVRSDAEALRADTARVGQALRSMRRATKAQSDSVAAWRRRAQRLRRRVATADSVARGLRRRADREAQVILQAPTPTGCEAAVTWAAQKADSLSTDW